MSQRRMTGEQVLLGVRTASIRALAPHAILAALLLALFWRAWLPLGDARHAFAWDAVWEYWGDLQFMADALRAGELPLWNPHDRLGYPFFADPQAGVMYPLNWPFVLAGALGVTPFYFVSIKILLHFQLAASGMFFLARRHCRSAARTWIALAAAGLLVTSYPLLHNAFSALNWSFAWTPWLVLAAQRCCELPSKQRGLTLGAVIALCALAGGWAATFYAALIAVPLFTVTAWRARSTWPRLLPALVIALGIAVFLAGAQIIATAQLLPHTVRAVRSAEFWGFTVLGSRDLVGFLIPATAGENTYLVGPALAFALLTLRRRASVTVWVLWSICLIGVVLAFGNKTQLLPWLADSGGPFSWFRRAHRYLYVVTVPFALLVALGFDTWITGESSKRWWSLCVAVALATLGCRLAPAPPAWSMVAAGLAVIVGALALGWWSRLQVASARYAVPLLVMLLVGASAFARSNKLDISFHHTPAPSNDAWAQVMTAQDVLPARIYDRGAIGYRPGTRLGLRDVGGYEGDPLALRRYNTLLQAIKARPTEARKASVHYITTSMHPLSPRAIAPAPNWSVRAPWADAFWTARVTAVTGNAFARATEGHIVSEQLSVDAPAAQRDATITTWRRNFFRATVDAPAAGVLVVQEMWHPGWHATVNGEPAAIEPINGFARGVPVPAGSSVVEMRFSAPWYVAWGTVAILAWLGLGALALRSWRTSAAPGAAKMSAA